MTIGKTVWAIAEGYIPSQSVSEDRELCRTRRPAC
jgi:hypothetical protein